MSPHIELDDDVFDYLKSHAEPFVDTPNTVLRRLLGLGQSAPLAPTVTVFPGARDAQSQTTPGKRKNSKKSAPARKRTRAAAGTLLPEEEYEQPLLQALVDAGGQAAYRDVAEYVGRILSDKLKEADFENLDSGGVRWQSRLQFVRLRLVERGLLEKNSARGIWAISDAGREALERRASAPA